MANHSFSHRNRVWGITDLSWRTKYPRMHLVTFNILLIDQWVMSSHPPVAHHDLPYIQHRGSPFSAFPANQRLSRHSLTSTFATSLVCTKTYHSRSQQSDSVQNVTCYWSPMQENTVYLLYVYKEIWENSLTVSCKCEWTNFISRAQACFQRVPFASRPTW